MATEAEAPLKDLDLNVISDPALGKGEDSPGAQSTDSGIQSAPTSPTDETVTPLSGGDPKTPEPKTPEPKTPEPKTPEPKTPEAKPQPKPALIAAAVTATASKEAKPVTIQHVNGPDEVLPTTNLKTWLRTEPVKLRMQDTGPLARKPISVISLLKETATKKPDLDAMAVKRDDKWMKWSYKQYHEDVRTVAKGFLKLGLEPLHSVGIIGFNCPEWFMSNMGAIFAGGFSVGVYTTNSPEACHYVLDNSDANIVVVENDQQLQKILKVRDQLPHLKAIVQWEGQLKDTYPDCYTWKELMQLGLTGDDDALETRIKGQAPNKCCSLIYTSGTTGNPKAVMLSHDNLTWTAKMACNAAGVEYGTDVVISYLPLSHIAAQLLDIYVPLTCAGSVYFARPDALKGTLGDTLKEVRPTAFLGVPRVWEKMMEKMKEVAKKSPGYKKRIALWAKGVGYRGNLSRMKGGDVPFGWRIANALVFKNVRLALGLDRCKFCYTGAAPVTRDTLDFFFSLDVQLLELYGMSESSGPHTLSLPGAFWIGAVGKEFPGASTKLDNPDADGNGEICMGGRHVFMGYLNTEEKTNEALDDEGWLHSGDIGKKDEQGYLYITGRIKELIITAGGENIAPVPIEDIVKEELPVVSNCMLIGDKRKFLSLLITIKSEVDADTAMPLDQLTEPAKDWCRSISYDGTTVTQVLNTKDAAFLKGIQDGIDRANKRSVSRAQQIQKWSLLPRDFSIPGGELGPTLKLKRPVVSKMYTNTIDAFYGE